jgi:hypothetical protein
MIIEEFPLESMRIQTVVRETVDEFIKRRVGYHHDIYPRWCHGLLVYFEVPEPSEYVQKMQYEKNTLIVDNLIYAKMPKYEKLLTHPDTNAKAVVLDMSGVRFYDEVTNWLLDRENDDADAE